MCIVLADMLAAAPIGAWDIGYEEWIDEGEG
jgi:hypothetical protein